MHEGGIFLLLLSHGSEEKKLEEEIKSKHHESANERQIYELFTRWRFVAKRVNPRDGTIKF